MPRLFACCLSLVFCWLALVAASAEDLAVLPANLESGVKPNQMLHAHLMRRAQEAIDRKLEAYEKLKTPEQIAEYQKRQKEFFVEQLGGFPERTPLNAKVVGRQQRDGYRVEKILLESQPGFYVTALLYLPEAEPPYPAVLVPCGHSHNGKARDLYQRAPILLAKNGMAALCYDPIEQGERFQLIDAEGKPYCVSVFAHQLIGVGSILLGRNTATFRIWDGMRCIDYLETRKEIDPRRIGCTGISGGGTLTSYLMALDDRILAAAPGCYITSFKRLLETIGLQDAEQDIHAQIAFGMDHADYVMMRAPRPTLIMTTTGDFFDIHGAWDSFRMAKRLYEKLGRADRVDLFETPGKHGWPRPMREAACRWMRRWLLHIDDAVTEPDFPVCKDEEVWCTPRGRVMLLPGARSTYDLNLDYEKKLADARRAFWQKIDKAEVLAKARSITGIRKLEDLPPAKWEKTGALRRDGYRIDKLVLRPEADVWLPALAFVPAKPDGDAYLYVHADGKQADAAPGGPIEKLAKAGHLVLAVDLRGLGETLFSDKRVYGGHLGADWQDMFLAYVLDTSYLAMRAEDILTCARFLADYETGDGPNRVHLISVGRTGPPALHAVALEPERFASAELIRALRSWSDVIATPKAVRQFDNVVHGALRAYDLPDLVASLPPEKITITEPLDAMEEAIVEKER